MATTTKFTVTKSWQKVSDANCMLQSSKGRIIDIQLYVGTSTNNAFVEFTIDKLISFKSDSPVFIRLDPDGDLDSESINVIK